MHQPGVCFEQRMDKVFLCEHKQRDNWNIIVRILFDKEEGKVCFMVSVTFVIIWYVIGFIESSTNDGFIESSTNDESTNNRRILIMDNRSLHRFLEMSNIISLNFLVSDTINHLPQLNQTGIFKNRMNSEGYARDSPTIYYLWR